MNWPCVSLRQGFEGGAQVIEQRAGALETCHLLRCRRLAAVCASMISFKTGTNDCMRYVTHTIAKLK